MSAANNEMTAGVEEDLNFFIVTFVKKRSFDFDTFLELWGELEFSNIFSGRPTVAEMKYFTREILIIAKRYALRNYTNLEQAAGIYLLYILYTTQPLQSKVRIRIELEEFKNLKTKADTLKAISKEVTFCFYKLVLDEAFDYVYSELTYAKERRRDAGSDYAQEAKQLCDSWNDDRGRFRKALQKVNFDEENYIETETKLNAVKVKLNDLLPPDHEKFEMSDFLTPVLKKSHQLVKKPSNPNTRQSHPQNRKSQKGKLLIQKSVNHDFEPEEEEEVFQSALSLPSLNEEDADDYSDFVNL